MVPWTNLITGAVGVAGISGALFATWLTNKSQRLNLARSIKAEDDRARQTEKRGVYARFLAAGNEAMQARFKWTSFKEVDVNTKIAAVSEYGLKTAEFITAASEIRLIAPAEVGDLADLAVNKMPGYDPGTPTQADDYHRIISRLIRAMRADLGELPLPYKPAATDQKKGNDS